jgi:hypothetical protein
MMKIEIFRNQRVLLLNKVFTSLKSGSMTEIFVCYTPGLLFSLIKTTIYHEDYKQINLDRGSDISEIDIPEYNNILNK